LRLFQFSGSALSDRLSARQLQVLQLLNQGNTCEQIARLMQITRETVNTHCNRRH
jgi:DNA-binding CsgD family transcriptional regulator